MSQEKKNNHIVSRCLTVPWEYGERQLRFFDFRSNSFGRQSSKTLFADAHKFTNEEEDTFKKLFEDPWTKLRERIQTEEKSQFTERERLSLFFMILLGSARFAAAYIPKFGLGRPSFAALLNSKQDELSTVHQKLSDRFLLMRIPVPAGHNLFVPETGIFPIPTFDPEISFATAVPVTLRWMVVLVPLSAKESVINNYRGQEPHLSQWSVGLNPPVNRIVIAPDLYEQVEEEELRERILLMRQGNDKLKKIIERFSSTEL